MILRTISKSILASANYSPVILIQGPRQSGKSTICKQLFSDKEYCNLEDLNEREFALSDPKGFLNRFPNGAIIDEIQKVPSLLSQMQVIVDANQSTGKFIITGSENLQLSEKVGQTLAGRVAIHTLLPFSIQEADSAYRRDLNTTLFEGGYPRIVVLKAPASQLLSDYITTYVERDVRSLLQIGDLAKFQKFLTLCASYVGQLLNKETLSSAIGISAVTIERWLSILEATFVCFRLQPWNTQTTKRLTKTPKLYFYDTGLLCALLGIRSATELAHHPLRGNIFENLQMIEVLKFFLNKKESFHLSFFRDGKQNEVDIVIERGQQFLGIECKSSQTFHNDFLQGLSAFASFKSVKNLSQYVLLGGNENQNRSNFTILPWDGLAKELEVNSPVV